MALSLAGIFSCEIIAVGNPFSKMEDPILGGEGEKVPEKDVLSSAKAITNFQFLQSDNGDLLSDITAEITSLNITAQVPNGLERTALKAAFTTTGESVRVGSTVQESGVSDNDFSNPVTYTVTAEDGSTQNYTVTVSENPMHAIIFKANGSGEADTTQSMEEGTSDTLTPCSFSRTGYQFSHWDTLSSGGGTTYSDGEIFSMGSSDVTLYAQWNSLYTVTYHGNGTAYDGTVTGTPVEPTAEYLEGDEVAADPDGSLGLVISGVVFSFEGWNTQTDGTGDSYNPGETFIIGTEDVDLYAQWTAIGAAGPAGGIIFYDDYIDGSDDLLGDRFLELAPQSSEVEWVQWSSDTVVVSNTTGLDIGTGESNTQAWIAHYASGSTYAAQICDGLSVGGYSDWFLPSRYELLEVCELGLGGLSDRYWSSTQQNDTYARAYEIGGGGFPYTKTSTAHVRAVRAF